MQSISRIASLRLDSPAAQYYDDRNDWIPGWATQAERWNGRLAMFGILFSIGAEALTGHSILADVFAQWLMLR